MSPQKTLFKPQYSAELFAIAQRDLMSAKELFSVTKQGRLENVVFLAQQSAEKAIKSALNHLRIPFPLVHELGTLVALLPDDKLPPGAFDLSQLNLYASVLRYQEPNAELTSEEVQICLDAVELVLQWSEKIISS